MSAQPTSPKPPSGIRNYVKHAFLYHWNLLLFLGGAAAAVVSPWPDALLPIVGGLELAYLTGLSGLPRFRKAIDAKIAARERATRGQRGAAADQTLERMIETLPLPALKRFRALRERCFEMRDIASGVHGSESTAVDSESVRTPALDRLLYLFLKLLVTQAGLNRFLKSTSEQELSQRLEDVRTRAASAEQGGDERITRSLQDSAADAELRLANYRKAVKDAHFVAIELDRIENKIQALVEMSVSRQDPDALSNQVTAAAESMRHTEETVNQLQHLTGLAAQIEETPAILEADMSRVLGKE